MFFAVITALLFVVTLLVIASLLYERRRRRRALLEQAGAITGSLVVFEKAGSHSLASSRWYGRRRSLLSLGLLAMLLFTFMLHDSLAGGALKTLGDTLGLNVSVFRSQPIDLKPPAHPVPLTASVRLVRIDSNDRRQYATAYEYNVWVYSSCSGIAMEMVMNAYGRHLIATDVLQVEYNLGVWSVQLGLLREDGIAQTAASFGFNTSSGHDRTLDDIIAISNKGAPVIVSVRNSYYYPGGHLFVIRGGDSQYVYIADSSIQNFTRMTRTMFLGMWQGFNAVLTPRP